MTCRGMKTLMYLPFLPKYRLMVARHIRLLPMQAVILAVILKRVMANALCETSAVKWASYIRQTPCLD